jgi:hypothetical protein
MLKFHFYLASDLNFGSNKRLQTLTQPSGKKLIAVVILSQPRPPKGKRNVSDCQIQGKKTKKKQSLSDCKAGDTDGNQSQGKKKKKLARLNSKGKLPGRQSQGKKTKKSKSRLITKGE